MKSKILLSSLAICLLLACISIGQTAQAQPSSPDLTCLDKMDYVDGEYPTLSSSGGWICLAVYPSPHPNHWTPHQGRYKVIAEITYSNRTTVSAIHQVYTRGVDIWVPALTPGGAVPVSWRLVLTDTWSTCGPYHSSDRIDISW